MQRSRARNILILAGALAVAFFFGLEEEEIAPKKQLSPSASPTAKNDLSYPVIINQAEDPREDSGVAEDKGTEPKEKKNTTASPFSAPPSTVYATKPSKSQDGEIVPNPLGTRESSETNKEKQQGKVDTEPPDSFKRYLDYLEGGAEESAP